MSTLAEALRELEAPKQPSKVVSWFNSLSEEDQEVTWRATSNEALKTYTLYGIFRENGLRCSKDTWVTFRKNVLAGNIKRDDIHE